MFGVGLDREHDDDDHAGDQNPEEERPRPARILRAVMQDDREGQGVAEDGDEGEQHGDEVEAHGCVPGRVWFGVHCA